MQISIIIPALNEADSLRLLLPSLEESARTQEVCEILVVDGGSTDQTPAVAAQYGAQVVHSEKGRACQMNAGAREARGEILYFLHADSFPPIGFDRHILEANSHRATAGCFRLRFDSNRWALRFFAWFTRINVLLCRGGDQSLFIPSDWFHQLGGYNEAYRVYEDNEFIQRLYREYSFKVLRPQVVTSARKYRRVGVWKLQYHFAVIHLMKYLGFPPDSLYAYYRKNIN